MEAVIYTLKDVIPKVLVMISHITIYSHQQVFTIGVGLANPVPVVNYLIWLHIIVAFALT